ncbi:two-component system alkaline phosphatase synthesis response regulator PhoP [Evansella vedderi]|uniref:Two-component system alkaline phosphatase synthesis response regulator PhoP n=1 Tax=Evansella vedderi TaxID=38282 RepID=A0ABT9ZYQ8_9BACI|nr:response regulator transcription factor [Evansella vedderi]MDQ0256383.1 two-component system alkaline phosphatase synthesis response regulator PhoP [Evansella vedderi]
MSQQILIVDDESSIVTLLQYNLEKSGFQVTTAMDGKTAFEKAINGDFDLIVLDIMLPEMDGLEVCKQLRQNKILTPILMLTAKEEEFDKIIGLELGADDYLTKPFSPREVIARIRAILRRTHDQKETVENINKNQITIGDLVIYPENHEIYLKGKTIELTQKEYELLLYLGKHQEKVLTRDQLLNAIWNFDFVGDTRIVDVHISHLREKIEANTKKPEYIKTIRGFGYKLGAPVTHE